MLQYSGKDIPSPYLAQLPATFDSGIMAKMNQKDKPVSVEISNAAAALATRAAQILGLLFEPATV